jgi:hypothetical protein
LTVPRCNFAVAWAQDKLYVAGGSSIEQGATLQSYEVWRVGFAGLSMVTVKNLSAARAFIGYTTQAAGDLNLNTVYFHTGRQLTTNAYTGVTDTISVSTDAVINSGSFSPGTSYYSTAFIRSPLNNHPYTMTGTGSTAGFFGSTYDYSLNMYDHNVSQSFGYPPLVSVNRDSGALVSCGKYVVLGGGYSLNGFSKVIDIWDMSNFTATRSPTRIATANLTVARLYLTGACLYPYVYFAGGDAVCTPTCGATTVDVLDLRDFSVFSMDPLPFGVTQPASVGVPGFGVIIAGGTGVGGGNATNQIWYYTCGNGKVESWEACDGTDVNCAKDCKSCNAGLSLDPTLKICCGGAVQCVLTPTPTPSPPATTSTGPTPVTTVTTATPSATVTTGPSPTTSVTTGPSPPSSSASTLAASFVLAALAFVAATAF